MRSIHVIYMLRIYQYFEINLEILTMKLSALDVNVAVSASIVVVSGEFISILKHLCLGNDHVVMNKLR